MILTTIETRECHFPNTFFFSEPAVIIVGREVARTTVLLYIRVGPTTPAKGGAQYCQMAFDKLRLIPVQRP